MSKFLFAALLFLLGAGQAALALQGDARLIQIVNESGVRLSDLSLLAVEGDSPSARVRLQLNPITARIPASVTKLVTAAVTLREFPPGTHFTTRVLGEGVQKGSVLEGNLILQGRGDPSFTSDKLYQLVNRLARTGLREVRGDIVVDDSYFDDVRFDPSRDLDHVDNAYDAPVGAMSFNWNTVTFYVRPGAKAGQPARVLADPPSDYIRIRGGVKTAAGKSAPRVGLRREKDPDFVGDTFVASGGIGAQIREMTAYKSITQPDLWAGAAFKLFLQQQGIKVSGNVYRGTAGKRARLIVQVEGKSVEEILFDMNKHSNNFVAEMLAKNLGARVQQPGTMESGMERMRDYLRALGVTEQEFVLVNPSGLSSVNRLSARALVRVLQDMHGNFQYQPEFIGSLPVAGVDGTLRKRLRGSPARRWVRAKTGYIDGSITLAGFAGREDGGRIAFAFLYNGHSPGYRVRQLYDRLCIELSGHRSYAPPPSKPRPKKKSR
ncbi:MAG: D-alanyl-D-alanine carboxypeptidase/D-alanyl-D-alanine endopeptidase [Nevskiales bacterium]